MAVATVFFFFVAVLMPAALIAAVVLLVRHGAKNLKRQQEVAVSSERPTV